MSLKSCLLTALLTVCCGSLADTANFSTRYPDAATKAVDVVVVGGGSSGSNAAIHLKDAGLDVLVVEKGTHLGGMVNSWTDPNTGINYDYGVAAYTNYTGTLAFFERLGLNVTEAAVASVTASYADMSSGIAVNYTASSSADELAALEAYYNISSYYQDLYLPSYAHWPAAGDIPTDLLLPFREFAEKYNIGAALFLMWSGIVSGLADMFDAPTVYVFQTFGPETAAAFLGDVPEYVPTSGRNQDIYDTVADILGEEAILYNSLVVESLRLPNDAGVQLLVQNQATKTYTIIRAKRLVMAIEPTASNMAPFDLDSTEQAVFSKGTWSVVNTGIVSHPSLPVDGILYNIPADAIDGNYYSYPEPPFVDYFQYLGEGIWQVIVIGWLGLSAEEAQDLASEAIEKMAAAGTIPATNGTNMTVLTWSNHGAMDMRVTADELEAGFIQEQYALQGHRSTFWTGAAFASQLSTSLWAYNLEYIVPLVLAAYNE